MSDSSEQNAARAAKKQLSEACRTKDTSMRLAWAITIGEGILLATVAAALMDYWLMLPVWMRTLGACGIGLVAGLGFLRLIRFIRRPTRLKEVALDIEAQKPDLGCEISTAAEYLSGERAVRQEYEPELVAALEAKAAERLRSSAAVSYQRRCVWPGVVLGLSLIGLLVFLLAKPVSITAIRRIVFPFTTAQYTQVEVSPGSVELRVGHDLEVTSLFTGRAPKDPQLHWQSSDQDSWQTVPLTTRTADGSFVHLFKEVRESLRYRITGSDASSAVFEIKAFVPPEVKELAVRIDHPSYTGLEATQQSSAEISAVRASSVEIQIEPSVKLSAAKVRFSSEQEAVSLQPQENGTWRGQFQVIKDAEYWIELADEQGRQGGPEKPFKITAAMDMPPTVEIPDPGQDMRASSTNKVPISISVVDEFGVEDIQVVFRKLGQAEHAITALRERSNSGEVIARVELDLSALSLEEYDVIAYQAVARDNNQVDGPGIGKSPVYFVEISNRDGGDAQPKGQGQPVNLLAIQKQIIADSTALPMDAAADRFSELATRQRDAVDFGNLYLKALTGTGAPAEASSEMESALQEMTAAGKALDVQKREEALPSEERALAHLYQVLKHLPELQDLPTQPKPPLPQQPPPESTLAVVLQAIHEKKEQSETEALEQALREAQQLAAAQSKLNEALRQAAQSSTARPSPTQSAQDQSEGQTNGEGEGQGDAEGKGKGQGKGKGEGTGKTNDKSTSGSEPPPEQPDQATPEPPQPPQAAEASPSKAGGQKALASAKSAGAGKGTAKSKKKSPSQKGEGKGKGSAGQAKAQGEKPQTPAEQMPSTEDGGSPDPLELAQQEEELSQQAAEMARKLQRLSSSDRRLGRNVGQNANLAGHKIAAAAAEIKRGLFGAAGVNGAQGELALRKIVAELEQLVREKPGLADVTNEDAPKEYEALISEYLRRLSHAE